MIAAVQRSQVSHVVGKQCGRENDRADDNSCNPEHSPAFLARWRHRHDRDLQLLPRNPALLQRPHVAQLAHAYSICVYERLIILMFLCQFMMLLRATIGKARSGFLSAIAARQQSVTARRFREELNRPRRNRPSALSRSRHRCDGKMVSRIRDRAGACRSPPRSLRRRNGFR